MMRFLLSLFALLLLASPAAAQENDTNIVKDSIYFTLDDGIMTQEEMEEEARYVHNKCMGHIYQSLYFDCACIAGAFLRERENRGPLALQEDILTELYRTGGETAKCGNGPLIAGSVYNDCMFFSETFRRLETNNQEYCQCVGNRVARDFSEYPYLRIAYISRLRVNALLSCEERFPATRENY
jgi:hypothetical protein